MCTNKHVTGSLCGVFFIALSRNLWEDVVMNLDLEDLDDRER